VITVRDGIFFLAGIPLCIVLLVVSVSAAEPEGLIASPEPGWPQWRGPKRDGVSTETGLLQSWPEGGPKLLWTATDLGRGYSSPIIVGETIYITGDVGRELHIFALNLDGKLKWRAINGRAWARPYPGARGSCTYAGGRLFHMNAHGRLVCLDAGDGRDVWAVDVLDRFDGRNIQWGLAESVLVDGGRVYVTPGGRKGYMAALDVKTGRTLWASRPVDRPGYASPILFRVGGRRLLVNLAHESAVCIDAETGGVQWTWPKPSPYHSNSATPVSWKGHTFFTTPSGSGGLMLRTILGKTGVRVEKGWDCRMDNISGGAVVVDGYLYGSGHYNTGWVCMDVRTGEVKYDSNAISQGSVIYADDRLYCLSERGHIALVKPGPKSFEVTGKFRVPGSRGADVWTHPIVLDGRLYLRYHDRLHCYDVRRP